MEERAAPGSIEPQIDNITDYAIYMLDPTGRVASWNAGARRIKGYEAAEILGQHFSVFYPAEARERAATTEMLRAATADGHTSSEGWRLRKSGERFWASVVITAVYRDGALVGFSKVSATSPIARSRRTRCAGARSATACSWMACASTRSSASTSTGA